MKVLIVGCGDIGMRVAESYRAAGAAVTGIVRGPASIERLRAAGVEPWRADLDADDFTLPDGRFDLVLHMAPPPREGDIDPRTARLLAAGPDCERLVYLSTTGVYGDRGGEWVDEDTPPAPTSDRGRRRLDAERRIAEWSTRSGAEAVVLRVAAIDRGTTLAEPDDGVMVWINRIGADDLARACVAAAAQGRAGAVYDCADGTPKRRRLSKDSGFAESKRIRARRLRDELGISPAAGSSGC